MAHYKCENGHKFETNLFPQSCPTEDCDSIILEMVEDEKEKKASKNKELRK